MAPTVYFVTGSARGIGFALVNELSSKSDVVVYAGVRALPLAQDSALAKLASRLPDIVIPIKITSAHEVDNAAAAEEVKSKMGRVDVLIANAGVFTGVGPIAELDIRSVRDQLDVNTIGPLVLFKAFAPLLAGSAAGPTKFIVISSLGAQITEIYDAPVASYGASKVASNYIVKHINREYKDVIAFPVHPGQVSSDMGRDGAAKFGITEEEMGLITPEESAKGILTVVQEATKETHGGRFFDYRDEELAW